MAEAARDNQFDSQGRPLHRNLNEEFLHVDGHDIFKTPSANLAVAANELAHLPQTPELAKVAAMLKAAHCQVNEIREVQRPSCSTSVIRRSADPRSNRRPSQSRFADQSPPPQGGVGGHRAEHHRQHDQEVEQDARVHLSNLWDARRCIDQRRFGCHEDEVRRRQEYEQEYGNPDAALEPIVTGNTADVGPDSP